ncbi:hypothetical protein [Methylovulum psychrotolerans]|uniref:Lipoprotein n=1 Tax=Methylovulum psychrotolerans TaxID=1704499 RepID=A0A1Z4C3G7_9GAMM|nr:hypothetical protein [Methylovulum psychrotolerans]ASF48073.1 hypothetical protein CEK71_19465 [Methylovulum psychrotolerans]
MRVLLTLFLPLLVGCVAIDYPAKWAELADQQRAVAYRQFELSRYDAALTWVRLFAGVGERTREVPLRCGANVGAALNAVGAAATRHFSACCRGL